MNLRKRSYVDYALLAEGEVAGLEQAFVYDGKSYSLLITKSMINDSGNGLYLRTYDDALGDGVNEWLVGDYRGVTVTDPSATVVNPLYDNEYRLQSDIGVCVDGMYC